MGRRGIGRWDCSGILHRDLKKAVSFCLAGEEVVSGVSINRMELYVPRGGSKPEQVLSDDLVREAEVIYPL